MKSKKDKMILIDLWSLTKDHKLSCVKCDESSNEVYTRKGLIKHLIKVHGWKPEDAKNAFKEIDVSKFDGVI